MQTHHRLRSRVKGVFAFAQSECTYSVDSARHTREEWHGRLRGGGMCRSNVRNTSVSLGEISEDCVYVRPDVSSIWTETCSIQHRDLAMVMAEGPSRLGSLSGYSRQGWSTSVEEDMAGEESEGRWGRGERVDQP